MELRGKLGLTAQVPQFLTRDEAPDFCLFTIKNYSSFQFLFRDPLYSPCITTIKTQQYITPLTLPLTRPMHVYVATEIHTSVPRVSARFFNKAEYFTSLAEDRGLKPSKNKVGKTTA